MYDVAVIGCGIVGAAAAYELSRYNCRVLVLEAKNDVANVTTKANSAILHAGYDPTPGTLMAETNVRGVALAKELCEKLDVEREEIGSLVLAFGEEDERHLEKLYQQGLANGVPGIELLTADEVHALEPNVSDKVTAALYAPTAAIVSPWEYALALAETAVVNGCELRLSAPVTGIDRAGEGYRLHTPKGNFEARYIINAAGLHCDKVHEMAGGAGFTVQGVRGEYYIMDKSQGHVVEHVIFQCPNERGKGVLVSPTVHGNLIVGPSADAVEDVESVANTAFGLEEVRTAAARSVPDLNYRESIRGTLLYPAGGFYYRGIQTGAWLYQSGRDPFPGTFRRACHSGKGGGAAAWLRPGNRRKRALYRYPQAYSVPAPFPQGKGCSH